MTVSLQVILDRESDDDVSQHAEMHRRSKRSLMVAEVVDGVRVMTHSPQVFGQQVVGALRLQA